MDRILYALEPFRHVDPAGWVGVYRQLPPPIGWVTAALGVLMLLRGSGPLFRIVATPLGAFIGATWTGPVLARFGLKLDVTQLTMAVTVVLALAGVFFPPVVVFLAFGLPAGLLGGQLVGTNDWLLGFAPGFLCGGALGVVFMREVAAVVAAAFGALLVVLGLMAGFSAVTSVALLANNPIPTLAFAGCIAIAGGVYQVFVRPSESELEHLAQEKFQQKKKDQERRALEDRWANYGKGGKKS